MRVYLVMFFCLIFSGWLMFHTFRTDSDTLYISSKVYSDFGSLIPLIRYFPYGLNFPIEHPLFPGQPIRYHFLFYAPIGFLESIGTPLDMALNIPSALGFFSLLFLIFYLGRKAGLVALILFLFNSSLSYLDFLKNPSFTNFVSFRPWNDSQITAFWNLNIYTNQRHLGFSFAVCLLIVTILYRLQNKYLYLVGFLFGSLLLLNQAGFLISAIFVIFTFLFYPQIRIKLIYSFIGFIPWFVLYRSIFPLPDLPSYFVGFLADRPLTIFNFLKFWFYNYGLLLIFAILALFYAPKKLIPPVIMIFIIGNLFQLSPDIINNHKLFNFVYILLAIFIASLFSRFPKLIFILPLVIMGGIVDLFPVINDNFIPFKTSPDQKYFQSLAKSSVVLNSTWFYHPASIAGLPIYNGYSYFTWSYGYNQEARENQTKKIYSSPDPCQEILATPITHIEIFPHHEKFLTINPIFESFKPDYYNPTTGLKVFSVSHICPNI